MKEKYVEERFKRWMIFGDLSMDGESISSFSDQDLIDERDLLIDMLVKLAVALDDVDTEVFKQIWYK